MSLAAGELNRRLTIQKKTGGKDSAGQPIALWVTVAVMWVKAKSQTGMGVITGEQNGISGSVTRYSFRGRYRRGLDAGMRALMDGPDGQPDDSVPYDITSVQMDEDRREWTDLVCNRGANNG